MSLFRASWVVLLACCGNASAVGPLPNGDYGLSATEFDGADLSLISPLPSPATRRPFPTYPLGADSGWSW